MAQPAYIKSRPLPQSKSNLHDMKTAKLVPTSAEPANGKNDGSLPGVDIGDKLTWKAPRGKKVTYVRQTMDSETLGLSDGSA